MGGRLFRPDFSSLGASISVHRVELVGATVRAAGAEVDALLSQHALNEDAPTQAVGVGGQA